MGLWTRWCLGSRDPWLWAVFYLLEGRNKWSRPVLLGYWALLGCISVAGWGRQVSRSRKFRLRNQTGPGGENGVQDAGLMATSFFNAESTASGGNGNSLVPNFPTLPNLTMRSLPTGANVSFVATEIMDAADKQIPTLGLNARRKFFHGLAVAMFLPGIALDVSRELSCPRAHQYTDRPTLAGVHASFIQCGICAVYFRGVHSVLCGIPFWCCDTRLHE